MNYKIFYLNFKSLVHIGEGNLVDSGHMLCADTLFSALCIEMLQRSGEQGIEELVELARANKLLISDAMPHIKQELWIPKPFITIQKVEEGNSIIKKSFKKLAYIPLEQMEQYQAGILDPEEENRKIKELGTAHIFTKATLREKEDAMPYQVGTYGFQKGNGLYIVVGFSSQYEENLINELMHSLSYSGVGGKRSSGYGQFTFIERELPAQLAKKMNTNHGMQITLSVSMAKEEELDSALKGAKYSLLKRSGYIQSTTYAETSYKKKEMYLFKSGGSFSTSFQGDIYNVARKGAHTVYRYGKPMFLEVSE